MRDKRIGQLSGAKRSWTSVGRAHLGLLGATLTLLAGCSAPVNDPLGTIAEPLSANEKTAFDFFLAKGLPNFQAAAIVGNLDQESGVNPTISQSGGGPGRGIAQWSAGARWDKTKGDNLIDYAMMQGMPSSSLTVQLMFIWYELQTFPQYGLIAFRASTNITDATQVFEDKYEGCVFANFPVCALPSRVNFAKAALTAYGNDVVPLEDAGAARDAAADGKTTPAADGGSTSDGATSPEAETTSDDAAAGSDAPTSLPVPDAEPPTTTVDTGAPPTTTPPETTSDAGAPVFNSANVDSGSCAVQAGGTGRSGQSYWLGAVGLALVSSRLRRRKV
jgi:MYXO-CTERM domain-containing protein